MLERKLFHLIEKDGSLRQMSFIAGPRQVGKTTLAKQLLAKHKCPELYFNWDFKNIRSNYRENADFYLENIKRKGKNWICFDEIHKVKNWKNILKEHFDKHEHKLKTIVTGSARLDLFRRSGDSLVGRYFLYHLLPLTLGELSLKGNHLEKEPSSAVDFIESKISRDIKVHEILPQLLYFSGFPEPLVKARKDFYIKWKKLYVEKLIYEDLKDISQIQDMEKIGLLTDLLPDRIGSLLSINSLCEDLEVNFRTARNYLKALELLCFLFIVKPYTKNIARAVKKESKVYLYDWAKINDDSKKFENYVACELYSLISFWNDSGYAHFDLNFVRTKDGKETDFLIVKDKKPWLLIEVKVSSKEIQSHHITQAKHLGGIPVAQIVYEKNCLRKFDNKSYIISADRFF